MMRGFAIAALGASAMLHLGGLHVFSGDEVVKIEGGAPAQAARLGNSFQDVAVGSATSVTSTESVQATTAPQTVTPVRTSTTPVSPVTPVVATATPTQTASAAPTPSITATEPVAIETPTPETPRPRARSERRPERQQRQPERSRPTAQPRGQAQAERRGQSDGREQARASQGADRNRAGANQGNAAASNYPGQVMRKISRTRRPRVGQRGSAVVGFSVSANGGIASARILRSSGNAQIDRAAVQHIHRAAPFPPPPRGATRQFQVRYDSR